MLSERFELALGYAARLHRSQRRRGSDVPYVAHLLSVAALVLEHGGSEEEAIAALLHDAVEDQGGDAVRQEIVREFGARVGEIVEGCTDTDATPKPPWKERKLAHLAHVRGADRSVRLVLAADKLHNGRSILVDWQSHGATLWERFSGGREGTLWYYREMVGLLRGGVPGSLLRELEQVVEQMQRLGLD